MSQSRFDLRLFAAAQRHPPPTDHASRWAYLKPAYKKRIFQMQHSLNKPALLATLFAALALAACGKKEVPVPPPPPPAIAPAPAPMPAAEAAKDAAAAATE
ncbi:MAG: hypothetical protein ABI589_09475, partial [Burkholderiales bacterium]